MYIICTVYTKIDKEKKYLNKTIIINRKKCTKTKTIHNNNNKCGYVKLNTYYY